VTERDIAASIDGKDLPPPGMAGALLRAAREAAGMSVDAVAQQLKLAPRQVRALEEGDYTHLPGRTFIRGFIRNYARLVRIDPEKVLGALPAGASAPMLEAPVLQQTAQTMGELPTNENSKSGFARWAIPMTLAAIIAAAATYEWLRPPGESRTAPGRDPVANIDRPATTSAKHEPPGETSGTSLQNPLAARAPDPPVAPPSASPAPAATTSPAPASAVSSSAPAPTASPAPASALSQAPANTAMAAAAPAVAPAATADEIIADQPLMLAFRDYSWTEVRDRNGRVLLSGMNPGGTAQTVSGTPPLQIVIGNATDVSARYKGQQVDLAPYTRQNDARFTLP
jgi:cytoskeleton protein RodZ